MINHSGSKGMAVNLRISLQVFSFSLDSSVVPECLHSQPVFWRACGFIYLLLSVLGLHCCLRFSPVTVNRDCLSSCNAWTSHFSGLSCCRAWAVGHMGFSSCGSWALEHRLSTGLVAPGYVESSWTRNWIHVSCIGRHGLCHWSTKEAPPSSFEEGPQVRMTFSMIKWWKVFAYQQPTYLT